MKLPQSLERFLTRTFGLRGLPPDDDYWYRHIWDSDTVAGVTVTEENALSFSAVYGCVKRLAESIGALPLPVYRRVGRGKARDFANPLYRLLHDQPNPEMTAKQYRQAVVTSMALWGNSYSFIERNLLGEPRALWPLNPAMVEVDRNGNGELIYGWRPSSGQKREFRAADILHPRLFSLDGLVGLSPISQAREAIALGLAEQEYAARLFSNDARPGGVLEHPGRLDDEIHDRIKRSWEAAHRGISNAHKVAVLEEGMKWTPVAMPAKDAEFLASRKLSVTEICRFYAMPPHMIQDLDRSTNNNIEQQGIEFVTYTLMPWTVEIEQEFTMKLFGNSGLFAEFLLQGLLRGDLKSRYDAYAVGRQWGWLSVNDIRELENMNPVEGGDEYLVPLNMAPAGQNRLPAALPEPAAMKLVQGGTK
jgi:HK97 family phage portal protein